MADETGISWTDHTFNPWWGCTRIAPGCDNCYAAAFDKRAGGNYWDVKVKPRLTRVENWKKVYRWNKQAEIENRRHRVFCGSMMDWCDKDAPFAARDALFQTIKQTPWLDWQLLTKRATRIAECLPDDWGDGYDNVWLGVTCENEKYGYPRVDILKEIPAKIRFVSAEPLLGWLYGADKRLAGIDWLIIGGESGPGYREIVRDWAYDLVYLGREAGCAIWFKQWGGNTRDKGGCLVNGKELKEWPKGAISE
ncbi:DUF5131 family protein [Teredinibacter turnerae]|uniref:DUF5131 family protein n=1 Tax=Teredinibacter turnerae TaxID=2426 RepID=UPI0030D29EE5